MFSITIFTSNRMASTRLACQLSCPYDQSNPLYILPRENVPDTEYLLQLCGADLPIRLWPGGVRLPFLLLLLRRMAGSMMWFDGERWVGEAWMVGGGGFGSMPWWLISGCLLFV